LGAASLQPPKTSARNRWASQKNRGFFPPHLTLARFRHTARSKPSALRFRFASMKRSPRPARSNFGSQHRERIPLISKHPENAVGRNILDWRTFRFAGRPIAMNQAMPVSFPIVCALVFRELSARPQSFRILARTFCEAARDVRSVGSGKHRAQTKRGSRSRLGPPVLATLILDLAKGMFAVWLAGTFFPNGNIRIMMFRGPGLQFGAISFPCG